MSSFAAGNLIPAQYRQWVIEQMEPGSYLLALNETWLCYLTQNDQDLFQFLWTVPGGPPEIPASVVAISQKAPVFYLNHPEDHGWAYCAIDKGVVVGRLTLDYESAGVLEENGFAALSLFGVEVEKAEELEGMVKACVGDIDRMIGMAGTLGERLSCAVDFISYDYVVGNEEDYSVIAEA